MSIVTSLDNLYRLKNTQIKPAAEMVTRAFLDNPGIVTYFPDENERQRILPYIFRYIIRRGLLHGEVYAISPNLEGVAIWLPSKNIHMTSGLLISKKLGKKNVAKMMSFNSYLASIHERHAPFKHWYLLGLAVNPDCQGKGYASILLKAMFDRTDKEHLPCYLNTQDEKNIPIYQHYGFRVVEESVVPDTQVTNWAMLREKVG